MTTDKSAMNDRTDSRSRYYQRVLAALLVILVCHAVVAEPVVWSGNIKLSESTTPCSLKIRENTENVQYVLSYGDNRTTQLREVTEIITPKQNRVSFSMEYFGNSFRCNLARNGNGSYEGDCVRDDEREQFSLSLENPVAAAEPRGIPLIPCCPGN